MFWRQQIANEKWQSTSRLKVFPYKYEYLRRAGRKLFYIFQKDLILLSGTVGMFFLKSTLIIWSILIVQKVIN